MHYTGTIWRPPYEAYSLLVQVTAVMEVEQQPLVGWLV